MGRTCSSFRGNVGKLFKVIINYILAASLTNPNRYIHREANQPHKFAIGMTISRTLTNDQGGHFYNSDYGIRVMGCSDTLFVFNPSHFHGTSLQDYSPSSGMVSESFQDTMLFVTPNRIRGLWEKYARQQVTLEEFREMNILHGDDEEEDED